MNTKTRKSLSRGRPQERFYHDGNLVGTLKKGIIEKGVQDAYFFKKHGAWGIDKSMIDTVPETTRIILRSDNGSVYFTSAKVIKEYATEGDYGWGKQYFLPLHYWDRPI